MALWHTQEVAKEFGRGADHQLETADWLKLGQKLVKNTRSFDEQSQEDEGEKNFTDQDLSLTLKLLGERTSHSHISTALHYKYDHCHSTTEHLETTEDGLGYFIKELGDKLVAYSPVYDPRSTQLLCLPPQFLISLNLLCMCEQSWSHKMLESNQKQITELRSLAKHCSCITNLMQQVARFSTKYIR